MNRAESPYDRIVDIPTKASEKEMKRGDRVVLYSISLIRVGLDEGYSRPFVSVLDSWSRIVSR